MKLTIEKKLIIPLLLSLIPLLAWLLFPPAKMYSRRARRDYEAALEKWREVRPASYHLEVITNSSAEPTAGLNRLQVVDGKLVQAENPAYSDCKLEFFQGLTIEALFNRIEMECLDGFPRRYCQVAYDVDYGFPRRIDFYPPLLNGQERSSIGVADLTLLNQN